MKQKNSMLNAIITVLGFSAKRALHVSYNLKIMLCVSIMHLAGIFIPTCTLKIRDSTYVFAKHQKHTHHCSFQLKLTLLPVKHLVFLFTQMMTMGVDYLHNAKF